VIVVDTSVWLAFFRSSDRRVVGHLQSLLEADEVGLAAPVRTEILSGASRRDRPRLHRLLSALPVLYPSDPTWRRIDAWILTAVAAGERFGFGDLLIASLAADEQAGIWSLDGDFDRMARLRLIETHAIG
jgi:predicted nucleic acid-binding protein